MVDQGLLSCQCPAADRVVDRAVFITLQHREALLNEIESYEQILMSRTIPHTLPDQELRAAGRFSLFLTAVRRVLDDIKHTRQNERQWDQNAFGNDLGSGTCIQHIYDLQSCSFERLAARL